MRNQGYSFIILMGLFLTIIGCGSDDKKSNSSQVCCQDMSDAGFSECTCGPQGTTSASGITMTMSVSGSSCTVATTYGSSTDTYSGKVVSTCN